MKAVWIMHDIVLTDEIQDILDELGVVGLSRWKRMTGRGPQSGTRMDNHVWPGANSGAMVVVGFAGAPLALVGFVFLPAPMGKARLVLLVMAGLLSWWWYPALGRPAALVLTQIHQRAENRARFGGCTQQTFLSPLPTIAFAP